MGYGLIFWTIQMSPSFTNSRMRHRIYTYYFVLTFNMLVVSVWQFLPFKKKLLGEKKIEVECHPPLRKNCVQNKHLLPLHTANFNRTVTAKLSTKNHGFKVITSNRILNFLWFMHIKNKMNYLAKMLIMFSFKFWNTMFCFNP